MVKILTDPNKFLTDIPPQSETSIRKNSYAYEIMMENFTIERANKILSTFNEQFPEL